MSDRNEDILKRLIEQGHISQELLDKVSKDIPSKDLCRCAELLHSMLCTRVHDGIDLQAGKSSCSYYEEELLEGNHWEKDAHVRWISKAKDLSNFFGLPMEEDLLEVIISSTKVLKDVNADVILLSSALQSVYDKDEILNFHKNLWEVKPTIQGTLEDINSDEPLPLLLAYHLDNITKKSS